MNRTETNILFTGGYDSTFRLLQAVIVEKRIVVPHYIIDHKRHSKTIEMRTMKKILSLLGEHFPEARTRVRETCFTHRRDIPKSELRFKQVSALKKQMHVGQQYFWLANYAETFPADVSFELSVMKHEFVKENLSKYFGENAVGSGADCRIIDNPSIPELTAFSKFRFPILHVTKQEMLSIAKAEGFAEILLNCWSCHRPTFFGKKPCGVCNPCKLCIENGFLEQFDKAGLKRYKKATGKSLNLTP